MTMKAKLVAGFSLLIGMLLFLGFYSLKKIDDISVFTEKLYRHPYAVSTAILRVDSNIVRIHRDMKDIALSKNLEAIAGIQRKIANVEAKVYADIDIIYDRFLGDKKAIDELRTEFDRDGYVAIRPLPICH